MYSSLSLPKLLLPGQCNESQVNYPTGLTRYPPGKGQKVSDPPDTCTAYKRQEVAVLYPPPPMAPSYSSPLEYKPTLV